MFQHIQKGLVEATRLSMEATEPLELAIQIQQKLLVNPEGGVRRSVIESNSIQVTYISVFESKAVRLLKRLVTVAVVLRS